MSTERGYRNLYITGIESDDSYHVHTAKTGGKLLRKFKYSHDAFDWVNAHLIYPKHPMDIQQPYRKEPYRYTAKTPESRSVLGGRTQHVDNKRAIRPMRRNRGEHVAQNPLTRQDISNEIQHLEERARSASRWAERRDPEYALRMYSRILGSIDTIRRQVTPGAKQYMVGRMAELERQVLIAMEEIKSKEKNPDYMEEFGQEIKIISEIEKTKSSYGNWSVWVEYKVLGRPHPVQEARFFFTKAEAKEFVRRHESKAENPITQQMGFVVIQKDKDVIIAREGHRTEPYEEGFFAKHEFFPKKDVKIIGYAPFIEHARKLVKETKKALKSRKGNPSIKEMVKKAEENGLFSLRDITNFVKDKIDPEMSYDDITTLRYKIYEILHEQDKSKPSLADQVVEKLGEEMGISKRKRKRKHNPYGYQADKSKVGNSPTHRRKLINKIYDLIIEQDPSYSPPSKFWEEDRQALWEALTGKTLEQLKKTYARQKEIAEVAPEEIARFFDVRGIVPSKHIRNPRESKLVEKISPIRPIKTVVTDRRTGTAFVSAHEWKSPIDAHEGGGFLGYDHKGMARYHPDWDFRFPHQVEYGILKKLDVMPTHPGEYDVLTDKQVKKFLKEMQKHAFEENPFTILEFRDMLHGVSASINRSKHYEEKKNKAAAKEWLARAEANYFTALQYGSEHVLRAKEWIDEIDKEIGKAQKRLGKLKR